MKGLKQEILELLDKNPKAISMLAYQCNKHQTTIERWIKKNDQRLTTETALSVISKELNVSRKDLLAA